MVDTKWGDTLRLRGVSDPQHEVVVIETIGPRGGKGSYVVLEERQARDLLTSLALTLADIDIARGRRAAA
jgi:hypothetical protein